MNATRALLAALLLLAMPAAHGGSKDPRPNILLIMADDMGINDLGHVNRDQTRTPHLDQLARQGISFSRHYTDSSCSPSRAALLTGMSPARVGFHPTALALPRDVVTLPQLLRQHGYRTAMFGKWHVGELLADDGPDQHGFDEWFGMLSHFYLAGAQHNGHLIGQRPIYIDPWLQKNGAAPAQHKGHIDDLLTAAAVAALAEKSDQPWFIYVPFLAPHTPTIPNREFAEKYPDTPNGRYRALIEQLDSNIGTILEQLDNSDAANNTIVIFVSDNGGTGLTFPSNAPFAGEKATYAEGGIRTPLIVHWPGHWSGGKRIDDVKYIADIYPTLAAALGLKADPQLDGVDLFRQRTRPLFWYSQSIWGESYSLLTADGKWRLQGDNKSQQLLHYADNLTPPIEKKNPALQAKLAQEFIDWRDSATLLRNSSQPDAGGRSKAVASAFRPNLSIGFSFSLPQLPATPNGKSIPLIANRQLDFSYAAGEFTLRLDSATLTFPHVLQQPCNSVYLNFNVAQDNSAFYGAGISQAWLYVNDNQPIVGKFKVDRLDSANFSPLTLADFNTRPGGPVSAQSVAVSSRILTAPEIAPALDALNERYCSQPVR